MNNYNNDKYGKPKNLSYNKGNNYNYGQDSNFEIIKKLILIIILFIILFLCYDFISVYKNVKKDNDIERKRCLEEYKANKCEQMTIEDGPLINEACTEKLKCITDHTVYFHVVLIKYLRSVISNMLRGSNIISISIGTITVLFIIKLLN